MSAAEASGRGLPDELADAVLRLATEGAPPSAIAAALGISIAETYNVITELARGTCAICQLRTRVTERGICRWHVDRPGSVQRCTGSGRRAFRSTGAARTKMVRASARSKKE